MPVPVLRAEYHKILAYLTPKWELFLSYLPAVGWFLVFVILLTIVVNILKLILSLRTKYAVLLLTPPRQTELSAASTAELFRLLHNLASFRPWYARLVMPAPNYSFEIVSRKGSGIQYLLRVPVDQVQSVSATLRGYLPGLSVTETSDYLADQTKTRPAVTEYGLCDNFAKPLAERADFTIHDPVAYLTNAMTQLRDGELIALQIVARPMSRLHDFGHSRAVNTLQADLALNRLTHPTRQLAASVAGAGFDVAMELMNRFANGVTDTLGDVVTHEATGQAPSSPVQSVEVPPSASDRRLTAAIASKLEQPLFVTSIRSFVQTSKVNRRARIQGITSSFGSFTSPDRQGIRPRWSLVPPLNRWQFRWRLLGKRSLLSATELAGIYHFPESTTTHTEDLVRSKSPELPAPLQFKQSDSHYDNIFATNVFNGVRTPIGLTLEERRRHTYILGATGTGKTTLLSTMIHQDIVNGKGLAVVDPHGQLVEQILRTIPEQRIQDVVWFAPADAGYPIALNLLDLPQDDTAPTQLQKSLVASSIDSIFKKFYDAKYFGPRMENLLRTAILTALETPNPTLLTVQDLLTKKEVRKSVVDGLQNQMLKDFWIYEFEKQGSLQRNQLISPVTNKIGGILSSPLNYNILTQPTSKLDFEAVMNDGKILLCDLSKGKIGEDTSSFFGSLIIAKLQLAALRRAHVPENQRPDFFLYVDEFQNFATSAFSELVSEARKYRLSTILAHQSISQIENRDIVKTILANVGTTISFRTANPEDESYVLPIFAPQVSKHEIANLPLYTCYMKVAVGQPQDAFKAEVNNFTTDGSDETAQAVVTASRTQFATPIDPVLTHASPTPNEADPRLKSVGQSGSTIENLFPLSLRGTEYGRDWQTSSSSATHASNFLILNQHQRTILLQLYRFRFLDRAHLQSLLALSDTTYLNKLLAQLTTHHYLTKHTRPKQPTIYSLATNGITAISHHPAISQRSLHKFDREQIRSPAFIQRSLLLADINVDLQSKTTSTIKYGMYLPSDYPALTLSTQLSALAPHAVIVRQKAQQTDLSIIETVSELPDKHLRPRLTQLIQAADSGEWRNETQIPFPALKFIASTPDVLATTQRLIKQITHKLEASKLEILITTSDQITKHSITGDIWTPLF